MDLLCDQCHQGLSKDWWQWCSDQVGELAELRNQRFKAIANAFHIRFTIHTPKDLADCESNLAVVALNELHTIAG
jgi:hypothetical protein